MQSRLSNLEDSVGSSDNSAIVERVTAVEINSKNNLNSISKLDSDLEKVIEHIEKSFKTITDSMNSNPLSLSN